MMSSLMVSPLGGKIVEQVGEEVNLRTNCLWGLRKAVMRSQERSICGRMANNCDNRTRTSAEEDAEEDGCLSDLQQPFP